MLLGGFPSVTMYTLVVAGAYVLVRGVSTQRQDVRAAAGVLVRAAAGVVLGFGLSAVQLLPFIKNLSGPPPGRARPPRGPPAARAVPHHGRSRTARGCAWAARGTARSSRSRAWPSSVWPRWSWPCARSRCRCRRGATRDRSPWLFFGVALVVVSILIWVGGPLLDAVEKLPFFASNRMSRAQSVFGFLGAVLAGVGFDRLGRWLGARRQASGDPGSEPPVRPGVRSRARRGCSWWPASCCSVPGPTPSSTTMPAHL